MSGDNVTPIRPRDGGGEPPASPPEAQSDDVVKFLRQSPVEEHEDAEALVLELCGLVDAAVWIRGSSTRVGKERAHALYSVLQAAQRTAGKLQRRIC